MTSEQTTWLSESFIVGDVGPVEVTGTRLNGRLRSLDGCLSPSKRPVRISCSFKVDVDGRLADKVLSAAHHGLNGRLSDDEFDELSDLVNEALTEWLQSGGVEFLDYNQARDDLALNKGPMWLAQLRDQLAALSEKLNDSSMSATQRLMVIQDMMTLNSEISRLNSP